ncbi:MAG: DUF6364 family protein [Cyclobacteriaceae bacterium]|jgi:hypothetical protein|nr:DUF6364 family protein [Cyclobacteriaceae bacterium]
MDIKLTIKLNQSVIQKAKTYAKKKKTSLSRLIESYLGNLTEHPEDEDVTPLVKKLTGILELKTNNQPKESYRKHIKSKYGK